MSTETGGQAIVRAQPVRTQTTNCRVQTSDYRLNLRMSFCRCTVQTTLQTLQPYNVMLTCQFLYFPCGVVRGALAALGINANVQAEINELPGAVFQIKTIPKT